MTITEELQAPMTQMEQTRPERNRLREDAPVKRDHPRVVVAGMAISETVRHGQKGKRHGIGGVAGNIAEALAASGNAVTMVTSLGSDTAGKETRKLLEQRGIRVVTDGRRGESGHAVIETRAGEQGRARGRWPMPRGLGALIDQLEDEYEAVASDAHMSPLDLRSVLTRPGKTTMANATSTRSAPKLRSARIPDLALATMNGQEMRAVLRDMGQDGGSAERVRRAIPAHALLSTSGKKGWTFLQEGSRTDSPAVTVPEGTDFIGCGDWAAAGALHAILHGLDVCETVNDFIRRKLQANIVQRRREA